MELKSDTYVSEAEKVILKIKKFQAEDKNNQSLKNNYKRSLLTTSQIRNLLTLVNEVYGIVRQGKADRLSEEVAGRVQYIKMRIVYEAGRDKSVRLFLEESGLLSEFDKVGYDRKRFVLLCNYMEALVAYHKFYSDEK